MTINPGDIRLEEHASGGRYVLTLSDGSQADLSFARQSSRVVVITHTGTPPKHRGQGIAAAMVERAVADFRAAGQRVVPACWYARDQFAEHPEWSDLLHREG